MIDVDHVDRGDRGLRVGVGRQQRAPSPRKQPQRLLQELDAAHLGHPVVGEQHRHLATADLHLTQGVEGLAARRRAEDSMRRAVAGAKVAGDGARHARVVVDGQDHRPRGRGIRGERVAHGWLKVGRDGTSKSMASA